MKIIEYLINRGIDENILNYCIINNLIYQEKTTNNVVFLGYDDENNIKYAGLRASNNTRIMHDAKGSSKEYSFRILAKEKVNSIHLFESAIDLLSYATLLKEKGTDWRNINLISLSGVYQTKVNIEESKLPIAIEKFLNKEPQIEEIILHFDNDMAGMHIVILGTFVNNEMGTAEGGIFKTQFISEEDLEWLKNDLEKNNLPSIVCVHFGVAEDEMKGNWWFESCPETALLGNRKELKEILKNDKNLLAVFSGHQHWTKKIIEDGTPYYVVGSMTENINNDGIPDGVYFIVEFDEEKLDVIEKHIRL